MVGARDHHHGRLQERGSSGCGGLETSRRVDASRLWAAAVGVFVMFAGGGHAIGALASILASILVRGHRREEEPEADPAVAVIERARGVLAVSIKPGRLLAAVEEAADPETDPTPTG